MNPHTTVICTHCRKLYDITSVETVARYADCTLFKAPCCGRTVDDRRWKSLPDITYLRDEVGAPFPGEGADAWAAYAHDLLAAEAAR